MTILDYKGVRFALDSSVTSLTATPVCDADGALLYHRISMKPKEARAVNTVSIDDAIALLNELLRLDPEAISGLVNHRVECNQSLADHPTVQVGPIGKGAGSICVVGILGILNGLFGVDKDGNGSIAVVTKTETGEILEFRRFEANAAE